MGSNKKLYYHFPLLNPSFSDLCSPNREYENEDSPIGFRKELHGIVFENIGGDICDEKVDVLGTHNWVFDWL